MGLAKTSEQVLSLACLFQNLLLDEWLGTVHKTRSINTESFQMPTLVDCLYPRRAGSNPFVS